MNDEIPRLACPEYLPHLVIPIIPDVDLIAPIFEKDLLPLLPGDKGGSIHGSPVTDDQTIPVAGLCQGEETVLNLEHGPQEVLLKHGVKLYTRPRIPHKTLTISPILATSKIMTFWAILSKSHLKLHGCPLREICKVYSSS